MHIPQGRFQEVMLHFTLEESLGVLSWSKNFPHELRDWRFLEEHLTTELLWLLCTRFSAVAECLIAFPLRTQHSDSCCHFCLETRH